MSISTILPLIKCQHPDTKDNLTRYPFAGSSLYLTKKDALQGVLQHMYEIRLTAAPLIILREHFQNRKSHSRKWRWLFLHETKLQTLVKES